MTGFQGWIDGARDLSRATRYVGRDFSRAGKAGRKPGATTTGGVRRWMVFTIIGALGFVLQAVTIAALTRGVGLHYLLATAIAVELAVLHNFVWHERWTWRDRPASGVATRLARLASFHLTNGVVSIAGNLALVSVLVEALGAPLVAGSATAMIATGVLNFIASDRLVFGAQRRLQALVSVRAAAVALLVLLAGAPPSAAQPHSETVEAWNRYARTVEARIAQERRAAQPPVLSAALMNGEVDVADGAVISVPKGLIHHWRGQMLLPRVTLEALLSSVDSPERTAKRQDDVLEARVLERDGNRMRLFLKVRRKSLVTVTYHTEYLVENRRDSPRSAWSRSIATKIAELEDAGTAEEREKPANRDWGLLWRLHAYWRYTEIDEGVLVELETISLSRGVPIGLGPIVRPIIAREGRQSLTKTLVAFRARCPAS